MKNNRIFELKTFIKDSFLWRMIRKSKFYRKRKNPTLYKQQNEELKFYKNLLELHPDKNELIFDVGANKGFKSSIFSRISTLVVAFEPTVVLYKILKRKFNDSNVIVCNYALSNKSGEGELFIVQKNQAYNSLNNKHVETTVSNRNLLGDSLLKKEVVNLQTLDHFIEKHGKPKFVKIDVEGYEKEVLQGLSASLPIISFEANLPEFREETIDCVDYLDRLSGKAYYFNFAIGNKFYKEKFLNSKDARDFIKSSDLNYFEVFAILSSSKLKLV